MRKRAATCLLMIALSVTRPAAAQPFGDLFSSMARMMASMMNTMACVADGGPNHYCMAAGFSSMHPGYDYRIAPPAHLLAMLNGRWYANNGVTLEIRGTHFRMHDKRVARSGVVHIDRNFLYLHTAQTGGVSRYAYLYNQYRLFLQDTAGRVLIFQRNP